MPPIALLIHTHSSTHQLSPPFAALAAGALVLSNGLLGSRETFGSLLPTFDTPEELAALLRLYLKPENAARKKALVKLLRERVLRLHTYDRRALELGALLERLGFSLGEGAAGEYTKAKAIAVGKLNLDAAPGVVADAKANTQNARGATATQLACNPDNPCQYLNY